jgi:hypothetical protein
MLDSNTKVYYVVNYVSPLIQIGKSRLNLNTKLFHFWKLRKPTNSNWKIEVEFEYKTLSFWKLRKPTNSNWKIEVEFEYKTLLFCEFLLYLGWGRGGGGHMHSLSLYFNNRITTNQASCPLTSFFWPKENQNSFTKWDSKKFCKKVH